MKVAGIEVELVQKDIKNLHLAVYPPDGRVRLAAPRDVNEKTLELYVTSKIPWIRRQQRKFAQIDRQAPRQYVDRESHYYLGRRYLLRIHEGNYPTLHPKILCKTKTYLDLYVKEQCTKSQKEVILQEWYRSQLKLILSELIPRWEIKLGVQSNKLRVQSMKTKWGSCNTETKNLTFNTELAKKPYECIEYVVVHELIHLIERKHNTTFKAYVDKYVPNWNHLRELLNQGISMIL